MPDKDPISAPLPQQTTPAGHPTDAPQAEPEDDLLEGQSKPMGCWMGIGLLLLLAVAFWLISILGRG